MQDNIPGNNLSLNEKIMIFIVMASEAFKKKSSAIFRDYGLTFPHYNVLKYLITCDGRKDTVGNLSKRMLVTGANVTGLAKRMEKNGLTLSLATHQLCDETKLLVKTATEILEKNDVRSVVMGHTHEPYKFNEYINTGCWTRFYDFAKAPRSECLEILTRHYREYPYLLNYAVVMPKGIKLERFRRDSGV